MGKVVSACWSFLQTDALHTDSPAARRGNLAKIPPKQVIVDLGSGSSVESETARCRAGIVERFRKFKMASKMAAIFENILKYA